MSAPTRDGDSQRAPTHTAGLQEEPYPPASSPRSARWIPTSESSSRGEISRRRGDVAEKTIRSARLQGPSSKYLCTNLNAEERLRRSEALLAQAEQLANIGSWELDVEGDTVTWSAHLYRMLGRKPKKAAMTHAWSMQTIHPDDVERAERDLDAILSTGAPLENELRLITADGSARLFHSRAVAITDENGKIVFVRGMSQDITESRAAEEKLRKSESLLSQAEEVAHLGSWEYDIGSNTARLSKNLLQMYGVSPDEEFTRDIFHERIHPRDRARVRRILEEAAVTGEPFEYESRYILPNGETRFLYSQGSPIEGPDGKPSRILGVVQDITEQKRMAENTRQLWRQMIHGRDEERRRVARELHESAGQSLAALKMNLARLYESLPKNRRLARNLWRTSAELAEAAVREVRTVSYLMHPPLLDEAGLAPALRWYARGFADRSKLAVTVDIAENFGRLPQEIETTVFRVVQEALTNVHRYSGSATARIRIWRDDRQLHAEVQDEGCGLTIAGVGRGSHAPPGVGIAGMRERVQQLNGAFDIESVPGKGTTVRATLPVDGRAKEVLAGEGESVDLEETGIQGRRKGSFSR